jgi:hypothetical protein
MKPFSPSGFGDRPNKTILIIDYCGVACGSDTINKEIVVSCAIAQ